MSTDIHFPAMKCVQNPPTKKNSFILLKKAHHAIFSAFFIHHCDLISYNDNNLFD